MKKLFITLSLLFTFSILTAQEGFNGIWGSDDTSYMTTIIASEYKVLNVFNTSFVEYRVLAEDIISQENNTKEIRTFTRAILELKQFLNNKEAKDNFGDLAFGKDLHPILCSRLIAIKILTHNKDETIDILDKYYTVHSLKKSLQVDYSYELFFIAIITKNTTVMRYLINIVDGTTSFYYQKHHMNSFYLMCMFYYKLTQDKSNQKKYALLFDPLYIRYSYEDFILVSVSYTHLTLPTNREV